MDIMSLVGKVGSIVKETGKQVGGVVGEKSKEVRDYAKDAMEIASLKNQIAACNDIITQGYTTLGEYYYKKNAQCPAAEMVDTFENIEKAEKLIKEIEDKIEEIKNTQVELKAAKQAAEEEAEELAKEAEEISADVDEELAKVKENAEEIIESSTEEVLIDDSEDAE